MVTACYSVVTTQKYSEELKLIWLLNIPGAYYDKYFVKLPLMIFSKYDQ